LLSGTNRTETATVALPQNLAIPARDFLAWWLLTQPPDSAALPVNTAVCL